ncbi:branched-chain amino acid ABC transporter substrate-binding protein [Actinomadura formosensis]|uniref:branched-chain amino acid ABC transporter substrate-binding protein n=1 Tax=Actinomadura formosensis TaxID=60706 RepID=UPI001A954F30|nr:branched-chain amino acid ABC transporter substrate-binding protein [Actinomadura formosensis]
MRRNKMRITGAVAVSAALALSAVACGGDDSDSGGNGNEVTIGFMGDLTGTDSGLVIPPKQGALLAIEQYNATNPKVKIKFKTYDSQGKPEQATSLALGAVKNDKIAGLIGPAFSGESQSVGPILEEAKIPSVSPSATNITLGDKGWKYWHRVVADDAAQSAGVANFVMNSAKAKKVFLVSDNQDYGKGLADAIEKAVKEKGAQTQNDAVDDKGTDYSSTVNKVNQFKPDVVYFGGYYSVAGRLFKQLREGGYKGKMMSGDGSLATGLIEGTGQQNAQGTLISCGCLIDPEGKTNPKAKKFADDYKAKFNSEVAIYSTEGFDAATAFIEAVKAGKTKPEEINEFLKTIAAPGVGKQIKFADNGELATQDIFIYQVEGNKLPLLGNSNEAKVS